jgi:hypothetical protein
LARRGSNQVYNTILKSREWLTGNFVINVVGDCLPGFYIFKGEWIRDDYSRLCKVGTCMAMQTKASMTSFHFKELLSFFKKSVLSEISHSNRHFLTLNEHRSHVIWQAIAQAQEFDLNMVTLLAHTSHALQTLDVSFFKPFKTSFKEKKKNNAMVKNNHYEPDKCTLASWVDKSLDQSVTKIFIKSGFRVTGI